MAAHEVETKDDPDRCSSDLRLRSGNGDIDWKRVEGASCRCWVMATLFSAKLDERSAEYRGVQPTLKALMLSRPQEKAVLVRRSPHLFNEVRLAELGKETDRKA
jgi:hypothetical protein